MKKIINLVNIAKVAVLGLFLPIASVQGKTIDEIIDQIKGTLNSVITLLFVLITIFFIWGVIQYVMAGGDDEKLNKGKKHMLWGIIGLAVVAAAWGITELLTDYLGVDQGTGPKIPTIE